MTELEKMKYIYDLSDACHLNGECDLRAEDCEKCVSDIWDNAIAEIRANVIEELREYVVNAMRHDCRIGWGLPQIIDYVDGCFTYKKRA